MITLVGALVGCRGGEIGPETPPASTVPYTETLPAFTGAAPTNVLMISLDTFRKDQVSRYGPGGNTPFLDGLMEQGFVLDDHMQCSNWTYASTSCTLLGRDNIDNGFMPKLSSTYRAPMPDGTPFLAGWLADAGYYTALVSSNSWLSAEWNNDQGYVDSELPDDRNATNCYDHGVALLDDAITRGDAERWFLHLHFKEPHPAYDPPEEYLAGLEGLPPVDYDLSKYDAHYDAIYDWPYVSDEEQELLEQHLWVRYHGEVAYLDDQLADMWADLEQRGWLDDTMVVFWTDHGEAFWEHGDQGHAYTLNQEENDGLMFFWSKNIVAGGWSGPTTAPDLAPTLLDLLDLPTPPEVTGVPIGTGAPTRARFAASEARIGPVQSVVVDGWKLQFWWSGELDLYDRGLDPLEAVDLFDEGHPKVAELWPLLEPKVEQAIPLIQEHNVVWPSFSRHAR